MDSVTNGDASEILEDLDLEITNIDVVSLGDFTVLSISPLATLSGGVIPIVVESEISIDLLQFQVTFPTGLQATISSVQSSTPFALVDNDQTVQIFDPVQNPPFSDTVASITVMIFSLLFIMYLFLYLVRFWLISVK